MMRSSPARIRRLLGLLAVTGLAVGVVPGLAPAQPAQATRAAHPALAAHPARPAHSSQAVPQPNAPMRMTVDSDHPLLLTQLNIGNDMGQTAGFKDNWNSGWSMGQVWASVPDELKGNIGFVLHQGHNSISDNNPGMSAKWLQDNVKEADALGVPVFILWDEGRTLRSNPTALSFVESLYQSYPHFMGTVVSEQTDTLGTLTSLLQLANNYGGFHVLGSLEESGALATWAETAANWNAASSYRKNFIFNPKNFHENFESVNAWPQGAWLAGLFDNWGPYFDGYPYYGCGYFGLNPTGYSQCGDRWSRSQGETVASMMLLDQWQNGATVFHLENQLDMPTTGSLYSPYFYQSILPAMRYILGHHTPTRAEVTARTKIAFSESGGQISTLADSTAAGRAGNPNRTTFFSMYEQSPQLTANQKQLWYYPRSSGRYTIIPRIPKLAPASLISTLTSAGATVLTKATYDPSLIYGDARGNLFDSKYPELSTGDAFVQKSGSDWLVYNSNERDNFSQEATLRLTGSTFTQLQMPGITPHTWAMVNENGTTLSMTLDTYRTDREADLLRPNGVRDMEFNRDFVKYAYVPAPQDAALRSTTLMVDVATRPTLTISGYDNGYTYSEEWNPNTHRYTLVVQSNGVVDISLSTTAAESGWTAVTSPSSQIVSTTGALEFTFDGTSVAWIAPSTATGTAVAKIDGVTFASAVPLAGGGTVFRATGLPNTNHTLRLEGSSLPVTSLKYVPSLEHSATRIETNTFNYGSQAADEDVVYGSEGWRVGDGKLKIVGYEFPFYGDTTVYNTAVKAANVSYSAKMTLLRGTSGALMVRGNEDAKSGYFFRLDPSRTAEGRTGSAGVSCSLLSGNATGLNSWTPVANCASSLTLSPNTEYTVVVTANGGTITASINGTQVLSWTGATTAAGWTGVRAPQSQSDSGGGCTAGGLQTTTGNYCLGQQVQLDDVSVTNLDSGLVVYSSPFTSWADAAGWMTETPLVFDWNTKPDPRSSFSFPYQWTTTGGGSFAVTETTNFTSGMSGYYTATALSSADQTSLGGSGASWATDGGYDYWAWLKVDSGPRAGLMFRASSAADGYQARLDVAAQTVSLGKVVGGTWTQLASAASPVPLAANTWQLLKVTAHGRLLQVDVGGRPAISLADPTYASGAAGLWVPAGGKADIEDARVVARTARSAVVRPAATIVPPDGVAGTHITGFDAVAVKTARTQQPALPAAVVARYSDGTKHQVPVTWPAISAGQLSVATNPTKTGPAQGRFTIQGSVAGTSSTAPLAVTVMPNLTTPFAITGTYSATNRAVPTQVPGTGTFSDGTSSWTKYLYVRWDTTPDISPGSPTTQVITGSINGYPWQKVSATITVTPLASATDRASGRPTTTYYTSGNPARTGAAAVDGSSTTGWYTGGATDNSFSDGTTASTQGSLCSWISVDLGADVTISKVRTRFGENLTTYGSMFDAPFQVQVLTAAQAAAHSAAERNSSVCTRAGGGNFGSIATGSTGPGTPFVVTPDADIWTTVATGRGSTALVSTNVAPTTARYVRILSNEPDLAHRFGTAVFDLQVF